jgi:hypothetical protein
MQLFKSNRADIARRRMPPDSVIIGCTSSYDAGPSPLSMILVTFRMSEHTLMGVVGRLSSLVVEHLSVESSKVAKGHDA